MPEPDGVSEDAFFERLLPRLPRLGISDGPHLLRGQTGCRDASGRSSGSGAGIYARSDGPPFARFLADIGGPAPSRKPGHTGPRWKHRIVLSAQQRTGARTPYRP